MIIVLACKCGNADTKAYKFLQTKVDNWYDVPMYRGRPECEKFLSQFDFEEKYKFSLHELGNFLSSASRFIVILGWDGDEMEWADISHGELKNIAKAELIVERFA